MKKTILAGLSLLFAVGAGAQTQEKGFVTVPNPAINGYSINKKSNYDGVCKALVGKDSSFVDGSADFSRVSMNLIDTNSVHNNGMPYFFQRSGGDFNSVVVSKTGQVVKLIAKRNTVLSQISCWGKLPNSQENR